MEEQTNQQRGKEGSTTIQSIEEEKRVSKAYNMFFSLYFLQGMVMSIGITMPYLYHQLPSYRTLSLFNTIDLPFSFKFIVSPFLEKYTNFSYGKRKTWIVISQFFCFTILIIASWYTQFGFASSLAIILMITQFFTTIQDISLDSLSIKQIRCPQKTSIVQSVAQNFGKVAGSLVLLKFTSSEFASKIGMKGAITTPKVMITCIAMFLMITCTIIHFFFKQTSLQSEEKGKHKNMCEIISLSKIFFNKKSKYCRFIVFLLIYYQGLNFFEAGYDYEMIKSGFSRDTSNTISNCISVIVLFLSFKIAPMITKYGTTQCLKVAFFCQCCVYAFNILVFSQNLIIYFVTTFLAQLVIATIEMTLYMYMYRFPIHGFTGMFTTLMLSIWNLSDLNTFSTLIINELGWQGCALTGIAVQFFFTFKIQSFMKWIQQGSLDIDAKVTDEEEVNLSGQKIVSSGSMFQTIQS